MSSSQRHRRSRRLRTLCAACQERKARFRYRGEVRADRDHTLCFQCYRAEINRTRSRRLRERATTLVLRSSCSPQDLARQPSAGRTTDRAPTAHARPPAADILRRVVTGADARTHSLPDDGRRGAVEALPERTWSISIGDSARARPVRVDPVPVDRGDGPRTEDADVRPIRGAGVLDYRPRQGDHRSPPAGGWQLPACTARERRRQGGVGCPARGGAPRRKHLPLRHRQTGPA